MNTSEKLEAIALMTLDLYVEARTKVPQHGRDFTPAYVRLNVADWNCGLTDIILRIVPIHASIPDSEDERWLELNAYRLPLGYKVSRVLKSASTSEIMAYLQTPELHNRILNALPQMSESLDDC